MTHSIGWVDNALIAKDSHDPLKLCSKHEPEIGVCDWFVVLLLPTSGYLHAQQLRLLRAWADDGNNDIFTAHAVPIMYLVRNASSKHN